MSSSDKYDRQIRMWGPHGQHALMESHICLLNATACGTETLKNLVLPGIGNFTIVDNQMIKDTDLGVNFFLTSGDIGRSRAEVIRNMLCEMNDDVKGFCVNDSAETLIHRGIASLRQFSLIIASDINENILLILSRICWENNIPLVVIQSCGMIGYLRLQIRDLEVIESKLNIDKLDLRITQPFEELMEILTNFDMQNLDSKDFSHVPFIIILGKALQSWNKENKQLPSTEEEKNQFKQQIQNMQFVGNEINFSEALKYSYLAFSHSSLPQDIIDLINRVSSMELTSQSSDFSFLVSALKIFIEQDVNGCPPLSGKLLDMTATTTFFLNLQMAFNEKATRDRNNFKNILFSLCKSVNKPLESFTDDIVDIFCKNVYSIKCVTCRPIYDEWINSCEDTIRDIFENEIFEEDKDQTPFLWYLLLRAAISYRQEFNHYPGDKYHSFENEISDFRTYSTNVLKRLIPLNIDITLLPNDHHVTEWVRFGGEEIHTVSSIIGGIASQEVVKIVTRQYSVLQNTYIYNGISGCGASYNL